MDGSKAKSEEGQQGAYQCNWEPCSDGCPHIHQGWAKKFDCYKCLIIPWPKPPEPDRI